MRANPSTTFSFQMGKLAAGRISTPKRSKKGLQPLRPQPGLHCKVLLPGRAQSMSALQTIKLGLIPSGGSKAWSVESSSISSALSWPCCSPSLDLPARASPLLYAKQQPMSMFIFPSRAGPFSLAFPQPRCFHSPLAIAPGVEFFPALLKISTHAGPRNRRKRNFQPVAPSDEHPRRAPRRAPQRNT